MLTNVVRGPICHAFSDPEQAGLTPRSEQMPLPSGRPNIVSIAAAAVWILSDFDSSMRARGGQHSWMAF
jgi:hypothetical protein